jgi:type II secretory ATPase GspE/PulE/Tfp pilus assembly ATPase PilB-like protein
MPHAFAELSQFTVDPASVRLLPRPWCLQHDVVVLGVVDPRSTEPVTVAALDPHQPGLLDTVSATLKRRVNAVRLNRYEIRKALEVGTRGHAPPPDTRVVLRPPASISFDMTGGVAQTVAEILGHAALIGASDVHLEVFEDDVDVRFRIDGSLRHIATPLARDNIAAAVSRIKVLAEIDIAERRVAQDGRINASFEHGGRRRAIDFRVSVVPGPFGEDVVLRVLDSDRPVIGLDALGFRGEPLARYQRLVDNPEGLVLVSGPTGSGKTTTLYATLDRLNTPDNKIVTVEDPIEYFFPKINQKQISPQMGFAEYTRAFMRQNPDIILIGEVRDEATAEAALRAAQTGHLVLATVHANDAVRTVSRLRSLGLEPNAIAGVLLGAVSQRLVRRLCTACRRPEPPEQKHHDWYPDLEGTFYTADGCDACDYEGYRGRVALYEIFEVSPRTADAIAHGEPIHEVRRDAIRDGMATLLEDGLAKAAEGLTSLDELMRVVPYRMALADRAG